MDKDRILEKNRREAKRHHIEEAERYVTSDSGRIAYLIGVLFTVVLIVIDLLVRKTLNIQLSIVFFIMCGTYEFIYSKKSSSKFNYLLAIFFFIGALVMIYKYFKGII